MQIENTAHELHQILARSRDLMAIREEAQIKRLLGMWVSGLEPCIYRDHTGALIGLGLSGTDLSSGGLVLAVNQESTHDRC